MPDEQLKKPETLNQHAVAVPQTNAHGADGTIVAAQCGHSTDTSTKCTTK